MSTTDDSPLIARGAFVRYQGSLWQVMGFLLSPTTGDLVLQECAPASFGAEPRGLRVPRTDVTVVDVAVTS